MLVFCCKLHRNLMIHENVMLQLHGKTHTKWVFSKNPHVFTFLHFFCKKKLEGIAQRNNCQSWEYDGFYNTKAACTIMKKTLPAVSESTRSSAILRGIRKAKARADEGSDRCCCCCCCCWLFRDLGIPSHFFHLYRCACRRPRTYNFGYFGCADPNGADAASICGAITETTVTTADGPTVTWQRCRDAADTREALE